MPKIVPLGRASAQTPVGAFEVLAESDLTRVVFSQGESDFILITFSPMRKLGKNHTFWADTYVRKNRVTTLSFVAKAAHWYPYADTLALIRSVLPRLDRGLKRICYGYSMGAYAALKFSRSLKADAALAFSPQFSIDPAEIKDPRFVDNYTPLNARMGINQSDLCRRNLIVIDRYFGLDRLNARLIAKCSPRRVNLVSVPFIGHSTVDLVSSSAISNQMFAALRRDPERAALVIRGMMLKRRRQLGPYYERLAKRVRQSGRQELAERIVALGAARTSNSVAQTLFRANHLAETDIYAAVTFLEAAIETDKNPRLKATLARFLQTLGLDYAGANFRTEFELRTGKQLKPSPGESGDSD